MNIADVAHLAERDVANVKVAGSIPVIRTENERSRRARYGLFGLVFRTLKDLN